MTTNNTHIVPEDGQVSCEDYDAWVAARLTALREDADKTCAWSCVGVPFDQRGEAHKRTCKP